MHFFETELIFRQILLHAARGQQRAVQAIGPLVIGTNQPVRPARSFCANDGTAMATNIVQCMNGIVFTTDDDDGIGINLDCEVFAAISNLAGMSREEPAGPPDAIEVEPVD